MKDSKIIHIFTICTNKYNEYFTDFISTLDYFMPEYWKHLHIISDINYNTLVNKINYKSIKEITSHHIFHQYYEFIQLSKLDFITQSLPNDDNLFFYFDIDTKFIEKDSLYWDALYEKLISHDLIFTKHPSYIYHKGKNKIIQGESFANMKGASKFNYDDLSIYVCTSIFGGKISKLNRLKILYDLLRNIDYKNRYLGSWGDEHYINRIINDKTLGTNMKLLIGTFTINSVIIAHFDLTQIFIEFPNIFCVQKYNIKKKDVIKN